MKKILLSLLTVSALATTSIGTVMAATDTGTGTEPEVSTFKAKRSAVKSFHFDRNTITGMESNFTHYKYIMIPAGAKQTGYQNQEIKRDWNFIRYLHTNFYQGGY